MIINENCPCKRKKCERHGKCDECRKHHAESERQRPVYCEKKKKVQFREDVSNEPCRTYFTKYLKKYLENPRMMWYKCYNIKLLKHERL